MKGKAKIDFEQWFVAKFRSDKKIPKTANPDLINFFYTLHPEFQQGVYLEYFRERETIIEVYFDIEFGRYSYLINKRNENGWEDITVTALFPDYSTAFTHAIDKACEIINGKEI